MWLVTVVEHFTIMFLEGLRYFFLLYYLMSLVLAYICRFSGLRPLGKPVGGTVCKLLGCSRCETSNSYLGCWHIHSSHKLGPEQSISVVAGV